MPRYRLTKQKKSKEVVLHSCEMNLEKFSVSISIANVLDSNEISQFALFFFWNTKRNNAI